MHFSSFLVKSIGNRDFVEERSFSFHACSENILQVTRKLCSLLNDGPISDEAKVNDFTVILAKRMEDFLKKKIPGDIEC